MSNSKVNAAATQERALSKNATTVLGVFGPKGNLEALVRLSSGRVKRVKAGSRVGSGKVLAIDEAGVMLRQSGQTKRIAIPGS